MKKKLTITIASILSVIVIIGVGFAAWVITNPKVEDTADGSISVETVTDKSYTLTAEIAENDNTIVFGKPANATTEGKWFTFDSSTKEEKLEATLTLTVKYNGTIADVGEITLTMATLNGGSDTNFASLVGAGYIVNPSVYKGNTNLGKLKVNDSESKITLNGSDFLDNTETKEATLTLTIKFGWGDHFKVEQTNVNPFDFYNAKTYTEGHNDAVTVLTELAKLNGVSYKVTVTGTTTAA
ncbi:MAG TPA: hypothetical protein DHU65_06645 [Clostridiales bacterium]|nr:hypothetical protein [Clostridiales bacterium]